nr:putative uncharacterized transmembrane protein DDB_G0293028 isoform X2 [Ipomoea batatas]GMD86185.1 putative uncharacterized transmembrane protein DDB_G0293028 isoform X2 [Ipomoea batatas]
MSMRSLALRTGLRGLMEGTPSGAGRSSFSGLRYFSDSTGRILSEEERAKENVYIQKKTVNKAKELSFSKQQRLNCTKHCNESNGRGSGTFVTLYGGTLRGQNSMETMHACKKAKIRGGQGQSAYD